MRARRYRTSVRSLLLQTLLWISIMQMLSLSACGRIGLDLLPLEADASLSDAPTTVLVGMCVGASCTVAGCPDDDSKTGPGICGCGASDSADADGDKVPDEPQLPTMTTQRTHGSASPSLAT